MYGKSGIFAPLLEILGYGVMVTLQILVLSFQVRILVAQHGKGCFRQPFFIRLRLPVAGCRMSCLPQEPVGGLRKHSNLFSGL